MSDQPTILMNISEASPYLTGFCDLKCDYSFYYPLSICSVYPYSHTAVLNFTYEKQPNGVKEVLYNGIEYNVSNVMIFSPSIHFFDGGLAEAEIVILHESVSGNGSPLLVCVPITTSSGSIPNYKGSSLVSNMIKYAVEKIAMTESIEQTLNKELASVKNNITGLNSEISDLNSEIFQLESEILQLESELPKTHEKRDIGQEKSVKSNIKSVKSNINSSYTNVTTITKDINDIYYHANNELYQPQPLPITDYTLEFIIPISPFFSYTDTNENSNYIVYGMTNAIFVDQSIIQDLSGIIMPIFKNPTYNDNDNIFPLFLNQTGATNFLTNNLSDEIYIDCQPTGSSNQQTNITTPTDASGIQIKTSSVQFLIYVMFFIMVLVVIYMFFAYITHPDKKNFSISSIKNPFA